MAELSPMMQQYFEIKQAYPDTILFFRLGDFYEMFFEDAKIASKELELVFNRARLRAGGARADVRRAVPQRRRVHCEAGVPRLQSRDFASKWKTPKRQKA